MARIQFPRLTKSDVEQLVAAHAKLVAVHQTLGTTNWAGARAMIVLVGEVDQLVARLFNKCEATWLRAGSGDRAGTAQEAPPEGSASDRPSEGEIAAPGKEGA